MPVLVSVPTKIRIDRNALLDHPDWVEEALRAAAGRALANSRASVLDLRGGYLGVRLHDPTFAWTGFPLDGDLRADWEERIAEWIRRIAEDAGVGAPHLGADVPETLPPDPSEPYDPLRGEPLGGMYALDSYGDGDKVVPIHGGPPLMHPKFQYVKISTVMEDEEVEGAMANLDPPPTREQPRGVIYRVAWSPGYRWRIFVSTGTDDDAAVSNVLFGDFLRPVFRGPNADPQIVEVPYEPPADTAEAEVIDLPSGDEDRMAFWMARIGDPYASELRRNWTQPIKLTHDAYETQIAERTKAHLAAMDLPADVTKVIRISMSGSNFWSLVPSGQEDKIGWAGVAILEPVLDPARRSGGNAKKDQGDPGEEKPEEGGGGQKKAGGSPAGQKGGGATGSTQGGGGTGNGKCPPDIGYEGPVYPTLDGSLENEPFDGEPGTDEIGDAGLRLDKQIAAIAQKLGIPAIKYAGQFCYQAAVTIGERAEKTQDWDEPSKGSNQATQKGQGNMGPGDFRPGSSPIIAELQALAETTSMVTDLVHDVTNLFESELYECSIHGWRRGHGVGWALDFLELVAPPMKDAVKEMFVSACRSMLVQMLSTSADEIARRLDAMPRYAPLFERWILPLIAEEAEYEQMRRALRNSGYAKAVVGALAGPASQAAWVASSDSLVKTLASGAVVRAAGGAYDIVQDGGVAKVRDSRGVLWSMDDLERGLKLRSGNLEGIDPLVKQMIDTPEAMQRFRQADSVQTELDRLLHEMSSDNTEMIVKASSETEFAFKASGINEDIPQATVPYSKYNLQGIHRAAHEAIGPSFKGSGYYPMGIDFLFDSELGKEALKGFGILVGMVVLCVFVPGGAFIAFEAGVVLASNELDKAKEKERLYKALIDPDLVLSHAEVEVGLFVAYFGLVMSFLPEVGTVTKGAIAGGKAILKGEGKQLLGMAGKAIASRVAKELVEYAARDFLVAFVQELATNMVMDQIMQKAMEPIIEVVGHNASAGEAAPSGGGNTGAEPPEDEDTIAQREFVAMILEETLAGDDADEPEDE